VRDAGRLEQIAHESVQRAGATGIDPSLGGRAGELRLKLVYVPTLQICG
jgi:hypothetical protein